MIPFSLVRWARTVLSYVMLLLNRLLTNIINCSLDMNAWPSRSYRLAEEHHSTCVESVGLRKHSGTLNAHTSALFGFPFKLYQIQWYYNLIKINFNYIHDLVFWIRFKLSTNTHALFSIILHEVINVFLVWHLHWILLKGFLLPPFFNNSFCCIILFDEFDRYRLSESWAEIFNDAS